MDNILNLIPILWRLKHTWKRCSVNIIRINALGKTHIKKVVRTTKKKMFYDLKGNDWTSWNIKETNNKRMLKSLRVNSINSTHICQFIYLFIKKVEDLARLFYISVGLM